MEQTAAGFSGVAGAADQLNSTGELSHRTRSRIWNRTSLARPFDGEGGGGEGGEGGGEGGNGNPPPGNSGDETFSKEQVENIVKQRVAQATKGIDELKTKAQQFDELQKANMTDGEKLAADKAKAEQERDGLRSELNSLKATTAIERAAMTARFVDPDAAAKLIDRKALVFDDDGLPTKDSLKTQLDELAKERPYLVGKRAAGDADNGRRGDDFEGDDGDMNARLRRSVGITA